MEPYALSPLYLSIFLLGVRPIPIANLDKKPIFSKKEETLYVSRDNIYDDYNHHKSRSIIRRAGTGHNALPSISDIFVIVVGRHGQTAKQFPCFFHIFFVLNI
jgi:hypothetical protein